MVHLSSSLTSKGLKADFSLKDYDYETLFRSPDGSGSNVSVIEPSHLSLDEGFGDSTETHLITPCPREIPAVVKTDTHDAALLLTSIKTLATKETMSLDEPFQYLSSSSTDTVTKMPGIFSQLCKALQSDVREMNQDTLKGITSETGITETRARTVSLDSQHYTSRILEQDCQASTFSTDALPIEQISLDLTSDQKASGDGEKTSVVARLSSPRAPKLKALNFTFQKGQRRAMKKKREFEHTSSISESSPKKKMRKTGSGNLVQGGVVSEESDKGKVLRKKFSWKSYPELEDFLIANREEYLRHSAMNYTMQQKEYNNRLTERLLTLASECGYIFDEECFSFVAIRDRIRCYFKSYVQSKKKRGLILGYAARRKGLITEEELEKSASTKGTIVVPEAASTHKTPKELA